MVLCEPAWVLFLNKPSGEESSAVLCVCVRAQYHTHSYTLHRL